MSNRQRGILVMRKCKGQRVGYKMDGEHNHFWHEKVRYFICHERLPAEYGVAGSIPSYRRLGRRRTLLGRLIMSLRAHTGERERGIKRTNHPQMSKPSYIDLAGRIPPGKCAAQARNGFAVWDVIFDLALVAYNHGLCTCAFMLLNAATMCVTTTFIA